MVIVLSLCVRSGGFVYRYTLNRSEIDDSEIIMGVYCIRQIYEISRDANRCLKKSFGHIVTILFLVEETLVEVDQIDLFGCAGYCGIEPAQHVATHLFVPEQKTIDKDTAPLAALCLVARYGI